MHRRSIVIAIALLLVLRSYVYAENGVRYSKGSALRPLSHGQNDNRKHWPAADRHQHPAMYAVITAEHSGEEQHHKMSILSLTINIVADLCPHGMLPLAYGISMGPTGIVPAVILVAIFGSMSAYTMTSFARLAKKTESSSIGEVWSKLVGSRYKWIADLAVFSLCFGCCVFYSAFVGDIFGALASAVGIVGFFARRWVVLAIISAVVLLPLCLLEDVSALQFSSVLGVGGIGFTFFFHALRLADGKYKPGSAFLSDMPPRSQPKFPTPKFAIWKMQKGTLVLVNMLCVAFLAHYNAINYYQELERPSRKRYLTAISLGFSISLAVFVGMMLVGYATFGQAAQPLLLNNFHRTKDVMATCARFATGLSITFAYPLMFAGLKSSMFSLMFPGLRSIGEGAAESEESEVRSSDPESRIASVDPKSIRPVSGAVDKITLRKASIPPATSVGPLATMTDSNTTAAINITVPQIIRPDLTAVPAPLATVIESNATVVPDITMPHIIRPDLTAVPCKQFVKGVFKEYQSRGQRQTPREMYIRFSDQHKVVLKTAAIVTVLGLITSIAFKCSEDDVSVVLGVVGSVLGCGVGYIMPALLQLKQMRMRQRSGLKNDRFEVIVNHILALLGTVFGALGVWTTLTTSHAHEH